MCINIDDIHQTVIFVVSIWALTRDNGDQKYAMLAPNKISHNNNCIE